MIKLADLRKSFGKQKVLDGLDLEIEAGKTTVIIGRSGGGKSVLLKHIIGLLRPDSGEVLIDGVDITKLGDRDLNEIRKKFGMLFQEAALFDSMTVGENVAFPLREHTRMKEREIRETVADRLHAVGLTGVEGKMPSELSGGMRKRVGLARAIAMKPNTPLKMVIKEGKMVMYLTRCLRSRRKSLPLCGRGRDDRLLKILYLLLTVCLDAVPARAPHASH